MEKNKKIAKAKLNVKSLIAKHRKNVATQQGGNCGPIGGWGD